MGQRQSFTEGFALFIKGIFMGSADIIPGVSGGTIALIVGIYERFITALQSINVIFLIYVFRGFVDRQYFKRAKERFFSMDFLFLIPLGLGILVAFLSLANIVGFGLDEFPSYTFAFFFGLILSSAVYVYLTHRFLFTSWMFVLYGGLGFLLSFLLVGLEEIQADHSIPIIFLAGVIAICAMILPGLSGAFILLVLGQYEFMLDVLRNLTRLNLEYLTYAVSFGLGAMVGLMGFSRILSYLLKKYHMQTLSFILGLMVGALRKPGEFILQQPDNLAITLLMISFGILLVALFGYYEIRIKKTEGRSSRS